MDNDETVAKAFRICVEADNCGVQDEAPCHTMDCPVAAAIRAAVEEEREACARTCDDGAEGGSNLWRRCCESGAAAIRARGGEKERGDG
jgi:hypothetical protein